MPKITEEELKIIQIRIFAEDDRRLQRLCGPGMNKNKLVRTIIRVYLNNTEAAANKIIDKMEENNAPRPS